MRRDEFPIVHMAIKDAVVKALKDVRAEIEDIDGITEIGAQILDEVLEIIEQKIAEVQHERT